MTALSIYIRDYGSIAAFGGPIFVAYTTQGGTGGQSSIAHFAEAVPQNDGASLVSTDHTVEFVGGRYTRYFWVRNETGTPTSFTLSGGLATSFYIRDYGTVAGFAGPMFVAYTIAGGTGYTSDLAYYAEAVPQNDGASLVNTDHTSERRASTTNYFWLRNETGTVTAFTLSGGTPP